MFKHICILYSYKVIAAFLKAARSPGPLIAQNQKFKLASLKRFPIKLFLVLHKPEEFDNIYYRYYYTSK